MISIHNCVKQAAFGALMACAVVTAAAAADKPLIQYNSNSPDFWKHPPPD